MTTTTREQLGAIKSTLAAARAELPELRRTAKRLSADYKKSGTGFRAATAASETVKDREAEISALEAKEIEVIEKLGGNGNRPDPTGPSAGFGAGWMLAAHELASGNQQVKLEARNLLRSPMAAVTTTPSEALKAPSIELPFLPLPADRRFIYPVFQRGQLEGGSLALTEFRQTSRTLTGEVERDPVAATTKADLALGIELRPRRSASSRPSSPASRTSCSRASRFSTACCSRSCCCRSTTASTRTSWRRSLRPNRRTANG